MNTLFNNFFLICDAPRAWGVYFQDSASPQMEALVELHDNIMFYLVIVLFGVGWILVSIISNKYHPKAKINHLSSNQTESSRLSPVDTNSNSNRNRCNHNYETLTYKFWEIDKQICIKCTKEFKDNDVMRYCVDCLKLDHVDCSKPKQGHIDTDSSSDES